MSGYNLAIADEFGFLCKILDTPSITTTPDNFFMAGVVKDLGNTILFNLLIDQYTEFEFSSVLHPLVVDSTIFNLIVVDQDGFLPILTDIPAITATSAVDTTPPTWTSNPTNTAQSFSGHTTTFTLSENGRVYIVAVPTGSTAPSIANIKFGQQADGSPALAFNSDLNVVGNVSTDLVISGILYNSSGVRYTDYDWYVIAEDTAGNLMTVYSGGNVVIDTAPTFSGVVDGSVDNVTHEITLEWEDASDLYNSVEEITYKVYVIVDSVMSLVIITEAGANSVTVDPNIEGTAEYIVRAINTRGLEENNTESIELTLGAGSGSYQADTGVLVNNAGTVISAGTPVNYRVYFGGDLSSPDNILPTNKGSGTVNNSNKLTINHIESGEAWCQIYDLSSSMIWSGNITFA